jgi:AraC family transcriptional activator of pobA
LCTDSHQVWHFLPMSKKIREIPTLSIESVHPDSEEHARDFDFFRLEYFAANINRLKIPHRHHFYAFIIVTRGQGSHDIDFQSYDLKPNRLFLIAPNQIHAWKKLKDVKGFVIFFTDSFIALAKGRKIMASWPVFRLDQPCYIDLSPEEAKKWITEASVIESEFNQSDDFSRDAIFYSVGRLLVRASRLYQGLKPRKKPKEEWLYTFQELIEREFLNKKTPKEYAVLMNITPNYLNSMCKQKSGKSAGELIRQRVLLEAKRLLAHTQLTIAEVAYKLNFVDNSYFGRYFKKYTGMTPESFREKQQ